MADYNAQSEVIDLVADTLTIVRPKDVEIIQAIGGIIYAWFGDSTGVTVASIKTDGFIYADGEKQEMFPNKGMVGKITFLTEGSGVKLHIINGRY